MPSCFGAALCTRLNVCGENGCWQHGALDPSALSERSAAASSFHMEMDAAECSQLPNKWLWLLLLHTKRWKNGGVLAAAWEEKGGINRERNKASVWLGLRNTQHDFFFGTCLDKFTGKESCELSCQNVTSHWTAYSFSSVSNQRLPC